MGAYSGALAARAHFPRYTSVAGVSGGHLEPTADPDPFQPEQEAVRPTTEDAWLPQEAPGHTEWTVSPVQHWTRLQPPVPSNVEGPDDDLAATARMVANHSVVEYRPDTYPVYRHGDQGRTIEYVEGRRPVEPSLEALQMGRNSYDATNAPSEVYGGERYRLGTHIELFGRYEFWTKQGQDGMLRAYEGMHPNLPVDKPRVEDSAPYTPNSSGTATWTQPTWQDPSSFALPSESALSEYQMSSKPAPEDHGFYDDDGMM